MADLPEKLPVNRSRWLAAVKEHDLVGKTVHAAELASASKMTFAQFLLLRILWKVHAGNRLFRLPSVLKPYLAEAKKLLSGYDCWEGYCRSIKNAKIPVGSFAIARYCQIKVGQNKGQMRPDTFDTPVARSPRPENSYAKNLSKMFKGVQFDQTPSKNPTSSSQMPNPEESDDEPESDSESEVPSAPATPAAEVPEELRGLIFPPTKDEQIVNAALVVFLNSLALHFDVIKRCDWTLHRKAFLAHFEAAQFEARTDGYLDDGSENPWALIEVKPVIRAGTNQVQVQIQEGSQMSGCIKNDLDAPSDKLRVHVSQNRHEIFITIAKYDSDYVSYLKSKPADGEPPSFMTMHQYGPWNTESAEDMRKLGPILLALTLYAEAEVKKAEALRRSSW